MNWTRIDHRIKHPPSGYHTESQQQQQRSNLIRRISEAFNHRLGPSGWWFRSPRYADDQSSGHGDFTTFSGHSGQEYIYLITNYPPTVTSRGFGLINSIRLSLQQHHQSFSWAVIIIIRFIDRETDRWMDVSN